MWLLVMFDLPVVTKAERKAATDFRLRLQDFGFEMAQFSVYLRFCASQHQAETLAKRVGDVLPGDGKINMLFFTDRQYERIITFRGRTRLPDGQSPPQFELF